MKAIAKKYLRQVIALMGMLLLTTAIFSQDPGGNPDGPPPAVPFDDYMNLIIVAAGIIFAGYLLYKKRKAVFA